MKRFMLSSADRHLIERDRAVPGLSTLLDPAAFARELAGVLPNLAGARVEIPYLRYKPGANCLARFQMELHGQTIQGYAKAYGSDASAKFSKAHQRITAPTPAGTGRALLVDSSVEVVFFPNDSKVKALHSLIDDASGDSVIESLLPDGTQFDQARLTQLAYKPERRFVAGLDLDGRRVGSLKLYADREFRRALHNPRSVSSGRVLRLPRQIGKSRRNRAILLGWLPGTPLQQVISSPDITQAQIDPVGAALAELHHQPGAGLVEHTRDDTVASVYAATAGMRVTCPELEPLLTEIDERLGRLIEAETFEPVAIHGDFYAAQVLLDGDRVSIVDLDNTARGNPAADLGLFIAHLERNALTGGRPKAPVSTVRNALLAGYTTIRDLPSLNRIDLHSAVGLVQLAPHHFRNREPDWEQRTAVTLGRVVEILDKLSRSVPPSGRPVEDGVLA